MRRDFGDDVFLGAAKYYAKYRPKYPAELFADIVRIFSLDGHGKLLDLGCGTGEMTIPLAKYFEQVLAVDPDPGMLTEGRRKAKVQKITNITWQKGSSKELTSLKPPLRLVAMGQSFHWMDQETVLNGLYDLLEPGGGVAIVGTDPIEQKAQAAKKDEIIQITIKKYLGPQRRAGTKIYSHPARRYEDLLPNKRLFGNQVDAFEIELRQKLERIFPDKKVEEKKRFSLYTVAK